MLPKDGRLFCEEVLAWVRRQRCKACVEQSMMIHGEDYSTLGAEAHHYPPKGMGGAFYRDDFVIPLCRRHHEEAQAYKIPKATQERWVRETRFDFIEHCTVEELRAYFDALEVYKDRPLAIPF